VLEAQARRWIETHTEVRVEVSGATDALSSPLQSRSYTGAGGLGGDPELAGRLMPSAFGEVFNISPVLINRDQWIYQAHGGRLHAVDAVKDRGLPLTFSGNDVATFAQLRLLTVAGGEYATCKALGLIKCGFGVAGPAGVVTCDVRGDATRGYINSLAGVLQILAFDRARLPPSALVLDSFSVLPRARIGYYDDGSSSTTVARVFDALLRASVGYYGASRTRALSVGIVRPPSLRDAIRLRINRHDIIDAEEIGLDQPSRVTQAITYGRNWTPMTDEQVSRALDSATRARLMLPSSTVTRVAGEVQQRDAAAVEGGVIESYWIDEDQAALAADRMLSLFAQTRRRFRFVLPRYALQVDLGDSVSITYPRFGFEVEAPATVIGVRDDLALGIVELTVWR
ncbi:MAG: hypothetical protein K2X34_13200, partial [Hyphomonadaceae bacterium]|nr:hypothetical protein [Hyphomonadaceae bacterium]